MTVQTKAERLADTLDVEIFVTMEDLKQAAAELRRLKSDNDDLKAEILEQCRINGMGADREDALRAEVERLKKATPPAQPAPEIAIADAYRAGVDSGIAAERERCCAIVFGLCESDNAAQRTVDAIRSKVNT